jgi:hypothetical protein
VPPPVMRATMPFTENRLPGSIGADILASLCFEYRVACTVIM